MAHWRIVWQYTSDQLSSKCYLSKGQCQTLPLMSCSIQQSLMFVWAKSALTSFRMPGASSLCSMLAGLEGQCDDADDVHHEDIKMSHNSCCGWQVVDARMKKLRSKITAQEKAAGGMREDVEVSISRFCSTLACTLLVLMLLMI